MDQIENLQDFDEELGPELPKVSYLHNNFQKFNVWCDCAIFIHDWLGRRGIWRTNLPLPPWNIFWIVYGVHYVERGSLWKWQLWQGKEAKCASYECNMLSSALAKMHYLPYLNSDKIKSNLSVPRIQGHQENAQIKSFEMSPLLIWASTKIPLGPSSGSGLDSGWP